MSIRESILHLHSPTEPTNVTIGDEWFDSSTNKLYKRVAVGGTAVAWREVQLIINQTNPSTASIASAATITPTANVTNMYQVTAQAVSATIAAPSGTPIDGQKLILRIKDNGTAQSLTWTTSSGAYRAVGLTLPTTTVLSKVLYIACIYNSQDTFWDVIATAQL
jgi:hypothetical protein